MRRSFNDPNIMFPHHFVHVFHISISQMHLLSSKPKYLWELRPNHFSHLSFSYHTESILNPNFDHQFCQSSTMHQTTKMHITFHNIVNLSKILWKAKTFHPKTWSGTIDFEIFLRTNWSLLRFDCFWSSFTRKLKFH